MKMNWKLSRLRAQAAAGAWMWIGLAMAGMGTGMAGAADPGTGGPQEPGQAEASTEEVAGAKADTAEVAGIRAEGEAAPAAGPGPVRLIVVLEGVREAQGVVRAAVFDQASQWLRGTPVQGGWVEAKEGQVEIVFAGLAEGTYGVSAFHDANNNETIDRGSLGRPLERFGFSNNARRRFGPAPFKEAAVTLGAGENRLVITLK